MGQWIEVELDCDEVDMAAGAELSNGEVVAFAGRPCAADLDNVVLSIDAARSLTRKALGGLCQNVGMNVGEELCEP